MARLAQTPTVDELLSTAAARTGLDDFGDDSFAEGLRVLVASLRSEARLNARGEEFLYSRIARYLEQRLHVEDWYRRHPEISDVPVVAPLIGLGLPRTGSTALSILLAQDPGARYLRRWESAQPCPPPATVQGADPRIPTGTDEMMVGSRFHVPGDPHGPMECHDLMALDFKSHLFLSFAQIPSYGTWLMWDADLTSTYEYQRRVMKLLQWGEPARPWRLKAPTHTLFLGYLDKAFPDARFVMTHRDPADVILSVAYVYADIIGAFTDHIDRPFIGRLNVEQWSLAMDRVLRWRADGAGDRFYDIDFRAMQADPLGQVRGLYAWLGERVSAEFERRMREWWVEAAAVREPSSAADPAAFGIDVDRLSVLFAPYVASARRWTARSRELTREEADGS
jgi:hypothetical protein